MLNIHFINVADGDSILIEDWEGERVFRMMVDTGRQDTAQFFKPLHYYRKGML